MATTISIPYSLTIGNSDPIDRRLVLSKSQMKSIKPIQMPRSDIKNYFALCIDDYKLYYYEADTEKVPEDPETGRFHVITTSVGVATLDTIGGVLSSLDNNKVFVNEDGTLSVNSIEVEKLIVKEGTRLIIDGGES